MSFGEIRHSRYVYLRTSDNDGPPVHPDVRLQSINAKDGCGEFDRKRRSRDGGSEFAVRRADLGEGGIKGVLYLGDRALREHRGVIWVLLREGESLVHQPVPDRGIIGGRWQIIGGQILRGDFFSATEPGLELRKISHLQRDAKIHGSGLFSRRERPAHDAGAGTPIRHYHGLGEKVTGPRVNASGGRGGGHRDHRGQGGTAEEARRQDPTESIWPMHQDGEPNEARCKKTTEIFSANCNAIPVIE